MKASKQFIMDNPTGRTQYISFQDGKPHKLVLLSDRPDSMSDNNTGEDKLGVRYKVKEDGVEKEFFTSSSTLISMLSVVEEGSEVAIQLRSVSINGQFRKRYAMKVLNNSVPTVDQDEPEMIEDDSIFSPTPTKEDLQ